MQDKNIYIIPIILERIESRKGKFRSHKIDNTFLNILAKLTDKQIDELKPRGEGPFREKISVNFPITIQRKTKTTEIHIEIPMRVKGDKKYAHGILEEYKKHFTKSVRNLGIYKIHVKKIKDPN